MAFQLSSTLDWLLLLCAEYRIRVDLILIPLDSLKLQWAGHAQWIPKESVTVEQIRASALRGIETGILRLMRHSGADDFDAAQKVDFADAAPLLATTRSLRVDPPYWYLEFTEEGANQWECKWQPDWNQYYQTSVDDEDAEGRTETIAVRCASWNRLGDLLSDYCRHFGYSQSPGLIDLKVSMERPWRLTYWKTLDSCYCAVFKVEQTSSHEAIKGFSESNPEVSFERWALRREMNPEGTTHPSS